MPEPPLTNDYLQIWVDSTRSDGPIVVDSTTGPGIPGWAITRWCPEKREYRNVNGYMNSLTMEVTPTLGNQRHSYSVEGPDIRPPHQS